MKLFIQRILLAALLAILSVVGLVVLQNCSRAKFIHVSPNTHIAFFGNSQIETAINDSIVYNSINWARSDDYPEFIYAKVKLIKKYNPQIDSIFIGFDNVLGFHSDKKSFPYQKCHPYFYDQYDFEDWENIFKLSSYDHWSNYFLYSFSWSKTKDYRLLFHDNVSLKDCEDLGGYVHLTRDKLAEHIARQKHTPHDHWQCSKTALYFFDKTIAFCKEQNISVSFICAPQHHAVLNDLESYKIEYEKYYSDIPFYDYVHLELADSCFADLNHLNYKGARQFSEFINQKIFQ